MNPFDMSLCPSMGCVFEIMTSIYGIATHDDCVQSIEKNATKFPLIDVTKVLSIFFFAPHF